MDLEEFNTRASRDASSFVGLLLERGQQCLEPFKRASVLADPDELNTTKTSGRVRGVSEMPDVLQNGSPRSNTNTSSDEDSNFVLKDILSRSSIGAVNTQSRHLLAVLQSDFVHTHGVNTVVELGLSGTSTESVSQLAGEVTDLANVDGDIGIERARGDGEGVPLVL